MMKFFPRLLEKLSVCKIVFGQLSSRSGADFEILIEQFMRYDNYHSPERSSNNLLFGLIDQTQIILSHR